MRSLPTRSVWGVVVPLVLLSPVLAFLLALAAEAMVVALHDAPVPVGVTLACGGGVLFLFRRLRRRAAQDVN